LRWRLKDERERLLLLLLLLLLILLINISRRIIPINIALQS